MKCRHKLKQFSSGHERIGAMELRSGQWEKSTSTKNVKTRGGGTSATRVAHKGTRKEASQK